MHDLLCCYDSAMQRVLGAFAHILIRTDHCMLSTNNASLTYHVRDALLGTMERVPQ